MTNPNLGPPQTSRCHRGDSDRRRLLSPLAAATVLLFLATACILFRSPGVVPEPHAGNGGALDRILLSEKSYEAGRVIFNHRLHYAPRAEGGRSIACKTCHHEYAGPDGDPPQACGNCHYSQSDSRIRHLPSL